MEENKKKENYEVAFLTKEEGGEALIKKFLTKYGALVEREKPVQKMRLSFPIKKENFAFLGTLVFSADSESVKGLVTDLNLENGILRYFLRKAKKLSLENRSESGDLTPKERKPFLRFGRDEKRGPEQALTNEALEKKIEEILQ
ncbi:MAG: 30S ribosomal protein S6 [Minisyncoccia bacterium]|jgi:ribosomal protein S6